MGGLPLFSLYDYRADDFNEYERQVALFLDNQNWVTGWVRNFSKQGYRIQGWHPNKVYPDFMVFAQNDSQPLSEFSTVYVLETKGLHLKGNEDTTYKQELFSLCNELSKPRPWNEVSQELAQHEVQFKVVFKDDWRRDMQSFARK